MRRARRTEAALAVMLALAGGVALARPRLHRPLRPEPSPAAGIAAVRPDPSPTAPGFHRAVRARPALGRPYPAAARRPGAGAAGRPGAD